MERAVKVFTTRLPEFVDEAADRVVAANVNVYAQLPRDALRAAIARAFATVEEDLVRGTTSAYPTYLREIGALRARSGTPIREMIHGLEFGFQVVSDHFKRIFEDDVEARLWWEERKNQISYAGALAVTDAFYTAREAVIVEQHHQIMRLSAPILPLYPGVLVLPLVGALGEERAAHVIESLLAQIARHRSRVVLLDVTGMLVDGAAAAEHLLRAARAAKLLGAKVILVGLTPDVALLLAHAGVDFSGVTVLGDLTRGLKLALHTLGRSIRP